MDSLTQIVLGASVAEAVAGKKMGAKAALWGAICGTIPDLDVFLRFWYDPIHGALVHRGFSHSLLFALLITPILGYLLFRLYRRKYEQKLWIKLVFLAIVTHPLLDIFTSYGTQFLWPFESRLSTNSIFVIDPIYTFPFMILLIIALFTNRNKQRRAILNRTGLIFSTSYLFLTLFVKLVILNNSSEYFRDYKIDESRTFVTPMPFTSFYWMIVTEGKDDFYIGYKSVYYPFRPQEIDTIPKNHNLINGLKDPADLLSSSKFISKGYYTCERIGDTLLIHDLRFGTSSKFTEPSEIYPIRSYGVVVDNQTVNKSFNPSPRGRFKNLNFDTYLNNVFH